MRNVYTLTLVGFVSFIGFAAHAQSLPSSGVSAELPMPLLSDGPAISDTMLGLMGQLETTAEPVPIIEVPLVGDVEVPEVNQGIVEFIDSRTGRYPPRLTINFAEFPLRSLEHTDRTENEHNAESKTPTDIVIQRIQNRLRLPQIQLVVRDRTATVSGTVATERQRNLVEFMLRFEPGISTVQNEITITP